MKKIHFNLDSTKNYADVQQQVVAEICQYLPDEERTSQEVNCYLDGALNISLFIRQQADIYIGHNLSDKNYLWTKDETGSRAINNFSTVLVPGYWLKKRLERSRYIKLKPEQIIAAGSPRIDMLRRLQEQMPAKLPGTKKKILWAPTHDQWLSKSKEVLSSYPFFATYLGTLSEHYDVASVLHPRNRKDKTAITEELLQADVIISDYSSVIYEAWALGKPVIFPRWLLSDRVLERAPSSAEAHIFRNNIGYHPHSFEELSSLLAKELVVENDVHEFMEEYLDNYRVGSASKKSAEHFIAIADENARAKRAVIKAEAVQLIADRNWLKAEEAYRRLIDLSWGNADYFEQLANVLRKQNKRWQEVESLKFAIAIEAHNPNWYYRLGEAEEAMKRFSNAVLAFNKAIELKHGQVDASWYYKVGYCNEMAAQGNNGVLTKSKQAYDQVIKLDKKLNAKRFGIGVYHQQRNKWHLAKLAYLERLKQQPGDKSLYSRVGFCCQNLYEWTEAESFYEKAIALDFFRADWHYRLGLAREKQEKYFLAAAAYEHAAKNTEANNGELYYRAALCLFKESAYEDACINFCKVTGNNTWLSTFHLAQENLSVSEYARTSLTKKKIEVLTQLLETDIHDPSIWYELGLSYELSNDYKNADSAYQNAIRRSSEHRPEWLYRRGIVLKEQGHFKDACDSFLMLFQNPSVESIEHTSLAKTEHQKRISNYLALRDNFNVQKNFIVYESWQGKKIGCNPYALLKYLLEHSDYRHLNHVIVLEDQKNIPLELNSYKNLFWVRRNSYMYLYYLATAKYLVNNTAFPLYFIRRPEQKYLNTWHGTPQKTLGKHEMSLDFKRVNPAKNFNQATHIISPNKFSSLKIIDGYDVLSSFTASLAEIGYPRIDLTKNTDALDIKRKLGIDINRKVILYAPTWRGEFNEASIGGQELDLLKRLSKTDAVILFRGHHLTQKLFEEINLENIITPDDTIDTNELLSAIDVLITDYSSIYFDFLVTGKPIIHFIYDYEVYSRDRGLYFSCEHMPGDLCYDIESVQHVIDTYLSDGYVFKPSEKYLDAKSKFCYLEDGRVSEKVASFLFNDDSSYVVNLNKNNKKSILIFCGHLRRNGITKSFESLLKFIDLDKYSITIAIDYSKIYQERDGINFLLELQKKFTVLSWEKGLPLTLSQRYLYNEVNSKSVVHLSTCAIDEYKDYFKTDFCRIFGFKQWDIGINFGGYSPYWSELFAHTDQINRKVIYIHNDIVREFKEKYSNLNRVLETYRYYDKCVFVSESLKDELSFTLEEDFSVESNKLCHVNNFIDFSLVKDLSEENVLLADNFSKDNFNFIAVGRLSPEKNHIGLIDAFSKLHQEFENVRLSILGDGPLRDVIQNKISKLKLNNVIHLHGYEPNPYPYIKASNALVLPSLYEGQGLVLLEALSLDVPCLATDIPGPRSVLSDGNGLLVSCDVESIYRGLKHLILKSDSKNNFSQEEYIKNASDDFNVKVLGE